MALARPAAADLAARLFGASPARRLLLLRAAWPLAAGPELSLRTEVVAVEGETVRVRVSDPSWRKEIFKVRGTLLRRLRRVVGSLAPGRLALVDGPLTEARRPKADPRPPPPVEPPREPILAAAGQIEDVEIRARYLESASRYLSRTRG